MKTFWLFLFIFNIVSTAMSLGRFEATNDGFHFVMAAFSMLLAMMCYCLMEDTKSE